MMEPMRHMGKSGKFAVICGVVAAGLLVLTGMTLAEPVFIAFLGVLALAYLAAVAEVLHRRRRLVLLATGAGTALTLGFSLAFLSTWELAFDGQSSFLGTPLPTHDPDNYFLGAACAAVGTLAVLFLGAMWPGRKRPATARRPAVRPAAQRATPQRATPQRATTSAGRGTTAARGQRAAPPRSGGQASAGQSSPVQRTSASRTPARGTSTPARRPPSSASPPTRQAPRPGSGSAPRR